MLLRRPGSLGLLLVVALLLGGCVARPPEAELSSYLEAFGQAEDATGAVVETFAPIERRNGARAAERAGGEATLSRETAIYFATIGLPPVAAQVRRGFDVVARYNEILVLYAEGRSFEEVRPQIDRFVASAGSFLSVAGSVGAGGTGAAAGAAFAAAAEPVKALLAAARSVADRKRFGEFLQETDELVLAVLDAERDAAVNWLSQAAVDVRATESDLATQSERVADYRRVLANWLTLLDQVEGAYRNLLVAVERGSVSGVDVASLAAWAEELRRSADSVRAAVIAARDGL